MCLSRLKNHEGWGLLVLRLVLGYIFILHGLEKWSLWDMTASEQMSEGMLNLFRLLSIVEPLGGLALILGFLTRWASLGLGIIMVGAIYFKMSVWGVPFAAQNATGWEFDLVLLAAFVSLMFTGAGHIALDRMMCKKK